MQIEINEKFKEALDLMENSDKHILITGRAGTGKSTLLDYFRNNTKKNVVVLAPTGVAAINVKGVTIHSFFKFRPDISLIKVKKERDNRIYRNLDAIIIDEISMVRADLLDCIDKFMRLNGKEKDKPFGGVQMIFFGDLYQLPPVVKSNERNIFKQQYKSSYFFDSKIFQKIQIEFIELEKIYRQKDEDFIKILNSIRNNSFSDEDLAKINSRVLMDFKEDPNDFYIRITSTKKLAEEINEKNLSLLNGKIHEYVGIIKGQFPENYLPMEKNLKVKIGAQVMLLNNDSLGRWVNGSIGKVVEIEKNEEGNDIISVELSNGKKFDITPFTWNIYDAYFDDSNEIIDYKVIGSFIQYPMKLAWAITIHKSQGKTFDKVIIDVGKGAFAHGQVYVALSRCTSLNGIILKRPITKRDIIVDWRIAKFLTDLKYKISEKVLPLEKKIKIIKESIIENKQIKIIYLKQNDTRIERLIKPLKIGEMNYMGKNYLGLLAYCFESRSMKTFRVDRIIDIKQ
ncbi:MAG: AAA family ATPase [Candidatus Aenigmatarchaeota archaeon]|nr:AAA family ATPase [Candidatus Aenigmarchaeota archaeon]